MSYPSTRIVVVSVVGLVSALLLAGCSSATIDPSKGESGAKSPTESSPAASPAGGTSATGACRLASVADVTTAMGEPMTQPGGTASDCIFAATADSSQQLLVHEFLDQTNMNNLIQQLESSSEHVDGLGDDAFWNGTIGTMFVRTGTRGFTITSTSLSAKTPSDPDGPKTVMVNLATTALSNF